MHRLTTTFVLGYHGCDEAIASRLVDRAPFTESSNKYDWLGSGTYFWEANPRRGIEFAREVMKRLGPKSTIKRPAVVGAIIDLRLCLDLSTTAGLAEIKEAHSSYASIMANAGETLPRNGGGSDRWLRNLDRAVLEHLHAVRKLADLPAFDTVRGFFFEGGPVYPNAGFYEKTHIQICVRNAECIHGVFRVPDSDLA
jgi:hypothetical protein